MDRAFVVSDCGVSDEVACVGSEYTSANTLEKKEKIV